MNSARRFRLVAASGVFITLVATLSAARADLVIKQQVQGGGHQGEMTIKIKAERARADLAEPVSIVTNAASGETLVLQHRRKQFTRISAEQTLALAAQIEKAKKQSDAQPSLKKTEQKEKVGEHETEVYTWQAGSLKMKFWVATQYPNGAAVQQQLDRLQNAGLAGAAAQMMPKAGEIPGVRLKTEIEIGGEKVTTTITSIKEEAVDEKLFTPPKGYVELPAPSVPEEDQ